MRKKPAHQFQTPPPRTYPSTPFTCVTCEMEIAGPPTFHVGLPFCCAGCAVSGPCSCSYDERDAALAVRVQAEAPAAPPQLEPVLAEREPVQAEREPVLAGR